MKFDTAVQAWNAQADEQNQWDALGEDEKIEWAMTLAAAAEREACAALCESFAAGDPGYIDDDWARMCADAIRARGADLDLARLTERGAVAWAGVDAQALREGRIPPNA